MTVHLLSYHSSKSSTFQSTLYQQRSMPRLPPSLIRQASSHSFLLPFLLRECRDLSSARNELRWLKEHVSNHTRLSKLSPSKQHRKLLDYVYRRSRGEPLQYILGTQPFGDLEILCRKHVLIPRPETEAYTAKVAQLILKLYKARVIEASTQLKIADLCSGSGCISLLLHSLLVPPSYDERQFHMSETSHGLGKIPHDVQIHGFDVSVHALRLSNDNQSYGITMGTLHKTAAKAVSFQLLDILTLGRELSTLEGSDLSTCRIGSDFLNHSWDVIVSNPPYISPSDFAPGGTTTRSVREYEPKLALVPPAILSVSASRTGDESFTARGLNDAEQADQFYHAILHIAYRIKTKLIVMEIGDSSQASRVRAIARKMFEKEEIILETWFDDGSEIGYNTDGPIVREQRNSDLPNERAVVVWRGEYASWRK